MCVCVCVLGGFQTDFGHDPRNFLDLDHLARINTA